MRGTLDLRPRRRAKRAKSGALVGEVAGAVGLPVSGDASLAGVGFDVVRRDRACPILTQRGLLLPNWQGFQGGEAIRKAGHPACRARDPLARGIAKGRRAAVLCHEEVQEEREASSCKPKPVRSTGKKRKPALRRKSAIGKSRAAGENEI